MMPDVRDLAIGLQSRHVLSVCCDAPVLLVYEMPPDLYDVHCGRCLRILGKPTGMDRWTLERGDLPPDLGNLS
jgi:hypothetical protein